VLRNATWLVAAQVLGTPVAIAVSALLGRKLGAADFGHIYLAGTLCGLGLHLVEWGQPTALPGLVAVERSRAGLLLGSALAWRAGTSLLVFGGIAAVSLLLDLDPGLRAALALVGGASALGSLGRACHEAVRGLERTEFSALAIAGQPLLTAAVVVPTLLLGGGLRAALGAQLAAAAIGLGALALALRPMGIGRLEARGAVVRQVVRAGSPFLVLGVAVSLQPNVDALLLARLSPPEVVGWYAAAIKVVGALALPPAALISALYPTLARLHAQDPAAYRATAAAALRTTAVLAVPAALGCALFPEVGVAIFGREGFAPANANLRLLAPFVLLFYFSMTLGCCITAAGRQRSWAILQVVCVAAAAGLDLLLIPWFQARTGNGGLGVAATLVACEVLMLAGAAWLVPPGLLGKGPLLFALRAALAGSAMALAAWALRALHPFGAAPLSLVAYAGVLLLAAGRAETAALLGPLRSRFRRKPGPG
jgi:O-antigen/teichoic acid export membrane protein